MMQPVKNMTFYGRMLILQIMMMCVCAGFGQIQNLTKFQPLDISETIPVSDVNVLYQDHKGFVWIGTGNGLYRYDGHHVQSFRNTLQSPHLLPSNEVQCLRDDGYDNLWIGTRQGICRMNLQTGLTKSYHFDEFDNSNIVKCLLVTRGGELWVGTEGGLYRYNSQNDSFVFCCDKKGNSKVPHASVTDLHEDHQGYVWIGTWDKGLYRYNPANKTYYEMPTFNPKRSAQAIYESNGVLWIGTWGSGLYKITNPYDTNKPLSFTAYTSANTHGELMSNIVWRISRDNNTGLLWVGTDHGLCFVQSPERKDSKLMALPETLNPSPNFFGQGANGFFCDRDNQMWAIAPWRGVVVAQTTPSYFTLHTLPAPYIYSDQIACLETMPDGATWVGLRSNGILMYPADGNSDYKHIPVPSRVYCIYQQSPTRIMIGTEYNGIYIYENGNVIAQENRDNSQYIVDNCVFSITQDLHNNLLIGTYRGLSVKYADGRGVHVEGKKLGLLANAQVRDVECGRDGTIWVATRNDGLLRLQGDIRRPSAMTMTQYAKLSDTDLDIHYIYKLLVDQKGRVWACSREAGLLVYDEKTDQLVSASKVYGLPDEDVYSIEESGNGNLWISMRSELICLMMKSDGQIAGMRSFQRSTAIGDRFFSYGLSSANSSHVLTFGSRDGFVTFPDIKSSEKNGKVQPLVTDILVGGMSVMKMEEDKRHDISRLLPPYTNEITLESYQRELTLQFASLNYNRQETPRFSYKLEGYDKDWIYPDASQSQVVYGNLPSGTYTFRLRCTDPSGEWTESSMPIHITVLAPFYLRWYAWLVYLLLIGGTTYLVVRHFKNKALVDRELQMAHMESRNIEQLNHKKLQFFTNITHDLMTPLTIISATISNLAQKYPEAKEDYRIVNSNVSRLMRLLQQILEFRKTETGNQHLRVSFGSITEFVRSEIESITPLAYKKNIKLSLVCRPEKMEGFFDSDKLDKIIYNLVSNATKYNHPDGHIWVTLDSNDGKIVVIRVKDDGAGIAADKLPSLFRRFYEGEHRKFNTYGMGIGLSLVKDLTTIHHGTITVDSELGKGSTFTVTLPIVREAFAEDEIEDSVQMVIDGIGEHKETESAPAGNDTASTILVVEDNEDLLQMLKRLLMPTYHVLTAYNGREAIEVVDNETVDLILTDVMMPIMDGMEMTRELRNRKDAPNCPIIMLTAKHDDEDRAEAYRAGADAYITKPFNTSVLMVRIQSLLQNKEKTDKEISEKLFGGIKDVKLTGSDQDFLNSCIKVVQEHIANADFDLPTFAQLMNTSKSTLYKKLRMLTGLSTSAFIRSIRMKSACELLRNNPEAHISDIAYAVGYNDPKYFSSCFKKDFGCLPSEYLDTMSKNEQENKKG